MPDAVTFEQVLYKNKNAAEKPRRKYHYSSKDDRCFFALYIYIQPTRITNPPIAQIIRMFFSPFDGGGATATTSEYPSAVVFSASSAVAAVVAGTGSVCSWAKVQSGAKTVIKTQITRNIAENVFFMRASLLSD